MNKKQIETIVLTEFLEFVLREGDFSVKEEYQKLIDEEMNKFPLLEVGAFEADPEAKGSGWSGRRMNKAVKELEAEEEPGGTETDPGDQQPASPAGGPSAPPAGPEGLPAPEPAEAAVTKKTIGGLIGKIGRAQAGLMKGYMNLMYGSGVWDDPNDARKFTQQVQANPGEVSDVVMWNISNPAMRRTMAFLDRQHREMDLRNMFSMMLGQAGKVDKQLGGDGEAPPSLKPQDLDKDDQSGGTGVEGGEGGEGKVPKETPLSITKRQKDVEGLRSATGATEVPLNAYIQKKLGFSAKSATRLAKGIGGALKGKGIPIAERKIVDIYALILKENKNLTLEDLIDEKWESVGAQAEIEGGTKPYHKKLKRANDRLAMLKDKMAAATTTGEKSKIQRAIRTVDARKDNLLRNLERVKGDRDTAKTDKNKATREAEKRGAKFGLIGKIMYKYAARQGEKDPEFMEKFGDDPMAQSKFIKKIRQILRRQLTRRGHDAAAVDKIMKESFDVAIRAIMPPLIEHIKKQKLL